MHTRRRLSHVQGYLGLGMTAAAAEELARIPAPDCDTPEVVTLRIAVLHHQENWPDLRDLTRAIVRRGGAGAGMWVTWAYATRRADSIEAAERILLDAEREHPGDATIQFNLGCYACQRGDLRAARRRVDCAIGLDPKFAEAAATDSDLAPLRAVGTTDCQTGD